MTLPIPLTALQIARDDEDWKQVCASFALEGLEVTDEDAEIVGRFISGEITFEEGLAEIRLALGLGEQE